MDRIEVSGDKMTFFIPTNLGDTYVIPGRLNESGDFVWSGGGKSSNGFEYSYLREGRIEEGNLTTTAKVYAFRPGCTTTIVATLSGG